MTMAHYSGKHGSNGFTLIEILVVLIIVGMTSAVVFQAFDRVYRLQNRFGVELFNAQQGAMSIDWFRQTVQGLLSDYGDGANKFSGSAHEFSGLSTNPLSGEYGSATGIRWKIFFDPQTGKTQLVYTDARVESPVAVWQGGAARFVYMDDRLEPHDTWPPALGMWPQLPRLIRVEAMDNGEPLAIMAIPLGSPVPLPRPQDFFGAAR